MKKQTYRPPFKLNSNILKLISEIERVVGQYEGFHALTPSISLRRKNRIKTIQASLAIEGNTLTAEQITAILDGKRIVAPKNEVIEVMNAIEVYNQIDQFKSASIADLLKSHRILMKDLIADPGKFRLKGVGIFKSGAVSHLAPPAKQLSKLMSDLFDFIKNDVDTHPILKSCIVHYELEFIHPFTDANGRMGRLWQHRLLCDHHRVFAFLPVEHVVRKNQKKYYKALEMSDKAGDSTGFVEFMLSSIHEALVENLQSVSGKRSDPDSRLEIAKEEFGNGEFSRKQYLGLLRNISTATASRDLELGVQRKMLVRIGERALTKYRFVG